MKTKIIGLTGGIGSGKSTVAAFFEELGVPVYYADDEAKKILFTPEVIILLKKEFGVQVFTNELPDRAKIASLVFADPKKLAVLNNIIHPRVAAHFSQWVQNSNSKWVIKEAAILFESGGNKQCDAIILVTAPEEIRINRVIGRDGVSREQVLQRIQNQWDDSKKRGLSNYVINNVDKSDTRRQVAEIFKILNKIEK